MYNLIEALIILAKYGNPTFPTHCEHDELTITPEISPYSVSFEDRVRLEKLGVFVRDDVFKSHRFGAC